ncbi:MAG: ECF transporter S component [Peptococcaceae bacterium]
MQNNAARKITFGGLMIALVFVTTFSVKIPIPFTQGYIHAGDSMIFVAAVLLGWKYGAIAGGVGSALADILGGYANWALPTLIIKSVMGGLVGWIAHDSEPAEHSRHNMVVGIFSAVGWAGFMGLLKFSLNTAIADHAPRLIGEVESITDLEGLLSLSLKLQSQLLWAAILIPLVLVLFSLLFAKINLKLFHVSQLLGMLVSGLWMVAGYYISAGIMYGSFIVPIFSIPWNIVQFVGGGVIAYFILLALQKAPVQEYLKR